MAKVSEVDASSITKQNLLAGDSLYIENLLSEEELYEMINYMKELRLNDGFEELKLKNGIAPRLIRQEYDDNIDNSSHGIPIYRHPSDEKLNTVPFNIFVRNVSHRLSIVLKQPFNHCLIQYYRSSEDSISMHADKTLDIAKGSMIVNFSLGAARTMLFSKKKDKKEDGDDNFRILLQNNSAFGLGWESNKKYLHGIKPDKRRDAEKSSQELAFDGERISFTFRNIATFLKTEEKSVGYVLTGQGAAESNVDTDTDTEGVTHLNEEGEREKMITAFGIENRSSSFVWEDLYGKGFQCSF